MKLEYLFLALAILFISTIFTSSLYYSDISTSGHAITLAEKQIIDIVLEDTSLAEIDYDIVEEMENAINPKKDLKKEIIIPKKDKVYVEIKDLKFVPYELNIEKGTTVVWVNKDWTGVYGRFHIIAGHYNKFRSPRLDYGWVFSFTFDEVGEYTYLDPIHKSAQGKVIVSV